MGQLNHTISYDTKHLSEIATFEETLDADDSSMIKNIQTLLAKKKIKIIVDILEIQQYYCKIADTTMKHETKCLAFIRDSKVVGRCSFISVEQA